MSLQEPANRQPYETPAYNITVIEVSATANCYYCCYYYDDNDDDSTTETGPTASPRGAVGLSRARTELDKAFRTISSEDEST